MTSRAARFARFATDLKTAGVRMTVQRRVLLTLLAEATDHPDATELYRRSAVVDSSVSLSTVYRTLRLLEDRGVVQRLAFAEGRARFENADAEHHDHLIYRDTGRVIEFQSERIEKAAGRNRGRTRLRNRSPLTRTERPQTDAWKAAQARLK